MGLLLLRDCETLAWRVASATTSLRRQRLHSPDLAVPASSLTYYHCQWTRQQGDVPIISVAQHSTPNLVPGLYRTLLPVEEQSPN